MTAPLVMRKFTYDAANRSSADLGTAEPLCWTPDASSCVCPSQGLREEVKAGRMSETYPVEWTGWRVVHTDELACTRTHIRLMTWIAVTPQQDKF